MKEPVLVHNWKTPIYSINSFTIKCLFSLPRLLFWATSLRLKTPKSNSSALINWHIKQELTFIASDKGASVTNSISCPNNIVLIKLTCKKEKCTRNKFQKQMKSFCVLGIWLKSVQWLEKYLIILRLSKPKRLSLHWNQNITCRNHSG